MSFVIKNDSAGKLWQRTTLDERKDESNNMPHLKKAACLLLLCFFLTPAASAAPLPDYAVELPRRTSLGDLADTSNVAAYGRFDASIRSKTLRKRVPSGTLVNYEQNFHVISYLKGSGPNVLKVLSTGIEPLPDAGDPWNAVYPGPMAAGLYIVFLARTDNAYYAINGRWQGVYPVRNGKTIALEGAGFPELNNLTVEQLRTKIAGL